MAKSLLHSDLWSVCPLEIYMKCSNIFLLHSRFRTYLLKYSPQNKENKTGGREVGNT